MLDWAMTSAGRSRANRSNSRVSTPGDGCNSDVAPASARNAALTSASRRSRAAQAAQSAVCSESRSLLPFANRPRARSRRSSS